MELEAVIGLEIHAQISTQSKMFCGCPNDSFNKQPNSNVCPICMGFPGMLPVMNQKALEKGVLAALALQCAIPAHSKFDRKNYFYPDLPAGFQISQYDEPISKEGKLEILLDGERKTIRIVRVHLENDAGKLIHRENHTLLDFNRAGSPLMEIVSYPDLRSAKEAREYAETVRRTLRYCGCSDCDMEKGMMRFDASVSLRLKGEDKLNPRAEIKNLNSFRSLEAAIGYEISRQKRLWEEGKPLATLQTVGWDDDRGTTELMREKESAADYRYFPEPDLPPIQVSPKQVKEWQNLIPELPMARYERFLQEFKLSESDARFYSQEPDLATYYETVAKSSQNPKAAASFIGTILLKRLYQAGKTIEESPISAQALAELIELVDSGTISNNSAKTTVFDEMFTSGNSAREIVEKKGLTQKSDSGEIEAWCQAAIKANPKAAEDVKAGIEKAMGALVGHVMQASHGQANPKMVNDILHQLLL